jgi:predicted glycogen debranching enzyme
MTSITLGRADCGHLETAIRKEWLVTNGLGGYAAGTISGANTRRYHGLLIAALRPPLERTLLVAKFDVVAHYDGNGNIYPLTTNEYADGTIDPHGYQYLESFHLEGLIPVWVYAMADARLEQRIWMAHDHNTTYVTFTLKRALDSVFLKLTPFCTYRDFHGHTHDDWHPNVVPITGGFKVKAFDEAQPYRIVADKGEFNRDEDWYWRFKYRVETYRGLEDTEDMFTPGHFTLTLYPGQTVTCICSTEPIKPHSGLEAFQQERQRQATLLEKNPLVKPDWIKQLTLAADQFVVRRSPADDTSSTLPDQPGTTIIAGYPWFGDWGRHTMLALPGLTLCTGRFDDAAAILRTFARFVQQGLLPNHFLDIGGDPVYNAADATLWYFFAIHQYLDYTNDLALVAELYPALVEIIDWHRRGTRYNIHVDPIDGLLFAGRAGMQLTWMDAKVGQWVITPRIGKPVEVNALWHNALRVIAHFSERLEKPDEAGHYLEQAEAVATNFRQRFWFEAGEYLYDVIDTPAGAMSPDGKRNDHSLRPNQILAISLPFKLLSDEQAKAVVDICALRLLTSYGLRSLVAEDPAYVGRYGGAPFQRDNAYHQGTVWAWFLGHFVTAHYRAYDDAELARSFLKAMPYHLLDACLGSISEIFDGAAPHAPRGCFAQAWSVAEVLRAWHELEAHP